MCDGVNMINHGIHIIGLAIDNTLPYGYETNHVSALISIKSSSSILVSCAKKTFAAGFMALRNDERLQVLQIVYTCDYLVGETTNCKMLKYWSVIFFISNPRQNQPTV